MINEATMQIYQANAILNAMEALAFNHEQGESDQTLVDIKLLCRSARAALDEAINHLDQPASSLV
jgi:hypothetical protein